MIFFYNPNFKFNLNNQICYYSTNNDKIDNNKLNDLQDLSKTELPKKLEVDINSDTASVFSEGMKVLGKALDNYAPAITGASVGLGAAAILKTLPPKERAGAIVTATAATGSITLLSQYMKMMNKDNNNTNPTSIPERPKTPEKDPNTFVDSPFEYFNFDFSNFEMPMEDPFNLLILAQILAAFGGFYGLTTVLLGYLFRLTNIQNKEWVTSRPRLHKFVLFMLKSQEWTILLTLFFVWICLILILFTGYLMILHKLNN
jgi:hypothetical protein